MKSFDSLEGLRFFLITKACDSTEKKRFSTKKCSHSSLSSTILMTSFNSPGHQRSFLRMEITAHFKMLKVCCKGVKFSHPSGKRVESFGDMLESMICVGWKQMVYMREFLGT